MNKLLNKIKNSISGSNNKTYKEIFDENLFSFESKDIPNASKKAKIISLTEVYSNSWITVISVFSLFTIVFLLKLVVFDYSSLTSWNDGGKELLIVILTGIWGYFASYAVILMLRLDLNFIFFEIIQQIIVLSFSILSGAFIDTTKSSIAIFLAILFYWNLRRAINDPDTNKKELTHLPIKYLVLSIIIIIGISFGLGFIFQNVPGEKLPFIDATQFTIYIVSYILMANKFIESKGLFIIANIAHMTMYGILGSYSVIATDLFYMFNNIATVIKWNQIYEIKHS